jgi:Lysyl oxidase
VPARYCTPTDRDRLAACELATAWCAAYHALRMGWQSSTQAMRSREGRRCAVLCAVLAACNADPPSAIDSTGDSTAAPATTSTAASSETTSSSTASSADSTTGTERDLPPPTPMHISPADGETELPLQTELCWNPVADPDGDALRYRVFVDGIELGEGALGEAGWPGPCLGPLTFAYERSYTWQVQAFEVDDPEVHSELSVPWSFTTVNDGDAHTVLDDNFDDDLGWTIGGDASSGAWIRGDPVAASDGMARSQPTRCDGGESCMFTGQNPRGVADDEDVAGGSTVMTSPPFDLGGAAAATVRLRRFFYKSDGAPEPALLVELLVPDDAAKGGFAVHPLEQLTQATTVAPENLWTPREYAACGVPMIDGSRLRITASDDGDGILEAAIDTVSVRAHDFATVCGTGEDGICDPTLGELACPDDLLCCAQTAVNVGVYRCTSPVAELDYDNPTADPRAPGNGPLGCDAPDLIIDESWIEPAFTDIMVAGDSCLLLEECVGEVGWRTILRFTMATPNVGSADLVLGVPANEPEIFHYSACHDHYHFDEYARYELRDADDETIAATGHKQAFCLLDTISWAWQLEPGQFDCSNQGISRGFSDFYESDLPCQWIDVTDVPPGDYILRAVLNQPRPESALPLLVERDYTNNVVEVPVTVP